MRFSNFNDMLMFAMEADDITKETEKVTNNMNTFSDKDTGNPGSSGNPSPDNGESKAATDVTKETEDTTSKMSIFDDDNDDADDDMGDETDAADDESDDMNNDNEDTSSGMSDDNTQPNSTDDPFQDKNTLKNNFITLHNSISTSIKAMDNYSTELSVGESSVFMKIKEHLTTCNDEIQKLLNSDIQGTQYVELMKKFITFQNVHQVCLNMLERFFSIKNTNEDSSKKKMREIYNKRKEKIK